METNFNFDPIGQTKTKRTIKGIIRNKMLDVAEETTLESIWKNAILSVCAGTIAAMLIYPTETKLIVYSFLSWGNWAALKIAWSFAVVFKFREIYELALSSITIEETTQETTGDTIEGIPVVELLDHLFTVWSFKRDDVEKRFAIPRNRFTDLANKFEEIWILVRGENNARILNPDFSRSDVVAILTGCDRAEDLKPQFRQIDASTYTTEPSRNEIVDRVKSRFDRSKKEEAFPSPSFRTHKLGESYETA